MTILDVGMDSTASGFAAEAHFVWPGRQGWPEASLVMMFVEDSRDVWDGWVSRLFEGLRSEALVARAGVRHSLGMATCRPSCRRLGDKCRGGRR